MKILPGNLKLIKIFALNLILPSLLQYIVIIYRLLASSISKGLNVLMSSIRADVGNMLAEIYRFVIACCHPIMNGSTKQS